MNIKKIIKRECPYLDLSGPIGDNNRKYKQALQKAASCYGHITDINILRIELGEARSRYRNSANHQNTADNLILNTLLDEQHLKRAN